MVVLIHCLSGGYEATTKDRKWSKVAVKMGYLHARGLGSLIRHHYERILYPFDVFSGGKLQSGIVSTYCNKLSFPDSEMQAALSRKCKG
jgi:hypothetical protein